jgi:hypothetical protein
VRRLGGAHVRAHRNVHSDVTGKPGQNRTDRETAGSRAPQRPPDDDEQQDTDDADGQVLAVEVRLRTGLNGGGDLAHPVVARPLFQDPADGNDAVDDRRDRAKKREDDPCGHGDSP